MKPEGPSTISQELSTCPYPERSMQSTSQTDFLELEFNIILSSAPRSS